MIPFSVLDVTPILEGGDAAVALQSTLDLARHAERWGYRRYWLAEHHNMPGIASAATAVVIGYVAGGTSSIRVGAGGIMLPNHSPLVVAEQFGTLESLYPGRIDLGLGRAPGTDPLTMRALRRHSSSDADTFPTDVVELMRYFQPGEFPERVRAVPGRGLNIPIWILGSSLFGAQFAAHMGLPFAFAAHFAPALLFQALDVYRSQFRPSAALARPHVMVALHVLAADTEREAQHHFTSVQRYFVNLRRGRPSTLPPPRDGFADTLSPAEQAGMKEVLTYSQVGAPPAVERGLRDFIARTAADELIITSLVYDHQARLRSYELTAQIRDAMFRS